MAELVKEQQELLEEQQMLLRLLLDE